MLLIENPEGDKFPRVHKDKTFNMISVNLKLCI